MLDLNPYDDDEMRAIEALARNLDRDLKTSGPLPTRQQRRKAERVTKAERRRNA